MKKNIVFCFIGIALTCSTCVVHADNLAPTDQSNQLQKISQNYFSDSKGRIVFYPCDTGGEPLVIYSSIGDLPISSKTTLYPIYKKKGYKASPFMIPDFETTEARSNDDLIIQTTNTPPNLGYLSINLARRDGAAFYVDTVNFPVVNTTAGSEGTKEKFVSVLNVTVNHSENAIAQTNIPVYNYNFDQSSVLYVYQMVKHIKASIVSWNQNTEWTNGVLGRNFSNIPYRYAPLKTKNGDVTSYDGFGFWICGSDEKQNGKNVGDQKFHRIKSRI